MSLKSAPNTWNPPHAPQACALCLLYREPLRKWDSSRADSLCFVCSFEEITNAIYLLGAFLCINLGTTVEQAWQPFSGLEDSQLVPYRDATWAKSMFDLELKDCWAGLRRAMATGFGIDKLSGALVKMGFRRGTEKSEHCTDSSGSELKLCINASVCEAMT